ncbi:Hint domain-containing protein [Nioella aestuarii]|uniref:Hint domain-containing protein n=1 Tax=Nioella aestuarii TaxID=1662864 RepID=UPI003D7F9669
MPTSIPTGYLFFAATEDGSSMTPSGTFTHINNSFNLELFDDGDGNADTGTDYFINSTIPYSGYTIEINGQDYAVFGPNTVGNVYVPYFAPDDLSTLNGQTVTQTITQTGENASVLNVCFAAGTQISTPEGARAVETLCIGDFVRTASGRDVPIKWLGRQTVRTRFGAAERLMPVRFAAGSLSQGVPACDLTVTADHGMLVDGVICHAGALVNGTTITRVPLAEMGEAFTVYHIETDGHEIILANGAATETFIDNVSRRVFDNFGEFEALYGDVPEMEELPYPRAMSARQVPARIKALLAGKAAA